MFTVAKQIFEVVQIIVNGLNVFQKDYSARKKICSS